MTQGSGQAFRRSMIVFSRQRSINSVATGIEGASTRAIAAAAGTTMSSITYHYGSKQGLYLAAGASYRRTDGRTHGARPGRSRKRGAARARDPTPRCRRLLAIIDRFVEMMVHPESAAWARFIVREQMEPTEAFDVLYGGVMGRMVDHLSALIVRNRRGSLRRGRGSAQDGGDRRSGAGVPGCPRYRAPRERLDRHRYRAAPQTIRRIVRAHTERDPHRRLRRPSRHDYRSDRDEVRGPTSRS